VESSFSRALPGHRLLHLLRFGEGGGGLTESSLDEGLAFLALHARRDRLVLRVTVDSFAVDGNARQRTADALQNHGFARVPTTRSYPRTLLLDLSATEEALFAGLHKNARQGVRNIARFPVRLSTVDSVDIAARLQQLSDRARQRTGGEQRPLDWRSFIEMTRRAPDLSRISILERSDRSASDSLLAFAWACNHGEIVEYAESGSIRTDDMKISSSYALLWDLILWAKRSGAKWFDLGGVTSGNTTSDDPLGGISDFKRRFSQHEVEVGEQWEFSPHPGRAALAKAVSATAALVRSGLKRRRV
jgi:lipid II:glycine glycyltransferase (peptidoglycan interpeptide bridge formation enzyme)